MTADNDLLKKAAEALNSIRGIEASRVAPSSSYGYEYPEVISYNHSLSILSLPTTAPSPYNP